MADVVMPRLSDTMEEGTILRWLKHDGDEVQRGDELVEIETDKATMVYEVRPRGHAADVAAEGDTLAVGELIARVGDAGANGAAADAGAGAAADGDESTAQAPARRSAATPSPESFVESIAEVGAPTTESLVGGASSEAPAGDGERVKASPLAKRDRPRARRRPARAHRQRARRAHRQGRRAGSRAPARPASGRARRPSRRRAPPPGCAGRGATAARR